MIYIYNLYLVRNCVAFNRSIYITHIAQLNLQTEGKKNIYVKNKTLYFLKLKFLLLNYLKITMNKTCYVPYSKTTIAWWALIQV